MTKKQNPGDAGTSAGAGNQEAGQLITIGRPGAQAPATIKPRLPAWAAVLEKVDLETVQHPPGLREEDELISAREVVTPAMRAGLQSWQRRGLDLLYEDALAMDDPLASDHFVGRMLSLCTFDGVSKEMITDTVADAMIRRKPDYDYGDATAMIDAALCIFAEEAVRSGRTARPAFDHEEHERMAHFVRRCSPEQLTAVSESKFFLADRPVAMATMNAFIHEVLSECDIRSRSRSRAAPVDKVRRALARIVHRAPETTATMEEKFFAERLQLVAGAVTPNSKVWLAWVTFCGVEKLYGKNDGQLFKKLKTLAKGRIDLKKRRVAAGEDPVACVIGAVLI